MQMLLPMEVGIFDFLKTQFLLSTSDQFHQIKVSTSIYYDQIPYKNSDDIM